MGSPVTLAAILPLFPMPLRSTVVDQIRNAVRRERLLDTAIKLIEVPSPTRDAGAVADRLAGLLEADGFRVERPACGWEAAPAVVVRWETGQPGNTIQFNGHLDTVHLPFVPPKVVGDRLLGSGASDMKAGIAAAVEALRVLRDERLLSRGGVLLTAHDLHEAPWASGEQINEMVRQGICGDAVLIPEYTHERLPVIGRGNAVIRITVSRPGPAVHEVFRPLDEPDVMAVGAQVVARFRDWQQELAQVRHPLAGPETVFLGQFHCGEIYNQYPQSCWLEGTMRWLPDTPVSRVEARFHEQLARLGQETGAKIEGSFQLIRDAFKLNEIEPFVTDFLDAYSETTGRRLPIGAKPFVDDGSCFWQQRRLPAITHGPEAGGAHTIEEWVSIDDLVRVATVYAATAVRFCG